MRHLAAIAAAFALGVLVTAAGVPMKVHYVNHDKVASGLESVESFNHLARHAIQWTASMLSTRRAPP